MKNVSRHKREKNIKEMRNIGNNVFALCDLQKLEVLSIILLLDIIYIIASVPKKSIHYSYTISIL